MIDITNETWRSNRFGGSERKRTLIYDGSTYMVKFPDPVRSTKKTSLSYINNQFSEHIGCSIFRHLGIPAQETFLATCIDPMNKMEKIVVACKLFCQNGEGNLVEFSKFLLNDTDSTSRRTTTIEDVMDVLDHSPLRLDREKIKAYFWDMFVVDAFIGNGDRHLDNWGLIEATDGTLSPAPIYDCGSSLSPLKSDDRKRELLADGNVFKQEEYNLNSVYRMNNERVLYHEIFKNPPEDLHRAILRIVPRIKTASAQIDELIDSTEGLSDISKEYMKKSLLL
nr:HipA domain-containing protein [uncultured Selenomonas sp.]